MKKINKTLLRSVLFAAALLLMSTSAYAATCVSTADGDWNNFGQVNWSCGAVPAAGDDVIINHDVFFTSDIMQINDLTISTGATLEQRNASEQTILGDMQISGTLTHGENTSSHLYEIDFSMQNLDLQAMGSIDVSGKGYEGGSQYQNGNGPSPGLFFAPAFNRYYGASGGGNGGDGGNSTEADGGVASCNISFPSNLGSSGGGADQGSGGDGGGLIFLNVNGTATLNGAINLNGGNGNIKNQSFGVSGGGAGGSFYLNTNNVAGNPSSFSATGGNGSYATADSYARASGSGGGGCVKILYTNSVSIAESDVDVDGGITAGVSSQTNPSFWYGGLGQVQITQNVAGSIPEFSTYVYMLTLLSALTIMYYFGRAKKLTV